MRLILSILLFAAIGAQAATSYKVSQLTAATTATNTDYVLINTNSGTPITRTMTLGSLLDNLQRFTNWTGATAQSVTNATNGLAPVIAAKQYGSATLTNIAGATGSPSASTYLRGDWTWATPEGTVGSYQPASANLTNWSLLATNVFDAKYQFADADLTNWATLATNTFDVRYPLANANLTNWSTLATNTFDDRYQIANANLTNWAQLATNTTRFATPQSVIDATNGNVLSATYVTSSTLTNKTTGNAATSTLATNAINATNFWGSLSATNLPASYVAPQATHATNADLATVATSANSVNATNVTYPLLSFASATNSLTLTNAATVFEASTSVGVTNILGATAGQYRWQVLVVSNSSAGNITLYFTAPGRAINTATTNALVVASGKVGLLSVGCFGVGITNYATGVQQ